MARFFVYLSECVYDSGFHLSIHEDRHTSLLDDETVFFSSPHEHADEHLVVLL